MTGAPSGMARLAVCARTAASGFTSARVAGRTATAGLLLTMVTLRSMRRWRA